MKHENGRRARRRKSRVREQGTADGHDWAERLRWPTGRVLLLLASAPPPMECGLGSHAPALCVAKEMDSLCEPATIVHEMIEHLGEVLDGGRWIGACEEVAELVEGRVPLERAVFVQIWYPFVTRELHEVVFFFLKKK
jgi:hypothetical protein